MNENQWFEIHRTCPGLLVTAAEVEAALAGAPDDIDTRLPDDLAAYQAALAAGAAAAWWQRTLAGDAVPARWIDSAGNIWIRSDDGHLSPPVDLNVNVNGIDTPQDLYAWLWSYHHAAAAPV